MAWRLSAAQWDVLTEALQLEGYPAPIQVRSHGRTDLERGRLRAEVGDELRRLGLVRAGRVEADLEAALRLLHRPASWVDSVWLPDAAAQQPVRVLAARGATAGVCALQHPDQPGVTVLEVLPTAGLAAAVVGRLPAHPPGRSVLRESPAVTIALAPSPERPGGVLVSASPVRTSVERERAAVSAILDQPHARAGQIAANVRDSAGRVRRSQVVRWCDNPEGRYQITSTDTRSRTIAPADPHRLATTLQHLLDSVH
ncbi:MAG: ESX secretion-associated protein EspG [Pseudonocardiaceae bacterium]